jgi:hypothetical protein
VKLGCFCMCVLVSAVNSTALFCCCLCISVCVHSLVSVSFPLCAFSIDSFEVLTVHPHDISLSRSPFLSRKETQRNVRGKWRLSEHALQCFFLFSPTVHSLFWWVMSTQERKLKKKKKR